MSAPKLSNGSPERQSLEDGYLLANVLTSTHPTRRIVEICGL